MALIDIRRINTEGGTQHRSRMHEDVVEDYAEAYLDDKRMPPVMLTFDGKEHWLWNGFHRLAGAIKAGKKSINCEITRGTQRDAFRLSLSANQDNGLRRSNEDKRNAVIAALQDAEFAAMSDRELAKICAVSHTFVAAQRPNEKPETQKRPVASTYEPVTQSGNVATLSQPKKEADSPAEPEQIATSRPKPDAPAPARRVPVGSLEAITAERDELRERLAESAALAEDLMAENGTLSKLANATDREAELLAEIKQLRAQLRATESRLEGSLSEKNQAVAAANRFKGKLSKLNGHARA